MIGTKLAHYEITSHLGTGGMGEVYQATDTKLGRSVAIKLLPEAFSHDTERVSRFQREARVLASLNHPNIAAIHGVEEINGRHFLIMELVPGETLAERIRRGAIPIEEALPIAKQIAEALEEAHEKGIIHRDLKPANIKVTPDGKVKVLDFGLAKAYDPEAMDVTASNSPTMMTMATTNAGVILGTAAYMSPEQAAGKTVDKRTDLWTFGVVLVEMLTGRALFDGETVSHILAQVLTKEPDWNALPANTPAPIRKLLRRCLHKNPAHRWQAVGDVRIEIENVFSDPLGTQVEERVTTPVKPLWKRAAPILATLAVGVAVTAAVMLQMRPAAPTPVVMRFSFPLPEGQQFTNTLRPLVAISPDGTHIVYVANRSLYLRRLGDFEAKVIPGTETATGVTTPVFSPDSQSIAFYSVDDEVIKRIAVTGGTAISLCPASNPDGMNWTDSGILFSQVSTGIKRVSANGGQAEQLVKLNAGELAFDPQMLPGDKSVLFTLSEVENGAVQGDEHSRIVVQTLGSNERKVIVEGGGTAHYLPAGYLVYALSGTLRAAPFDLRALKVTAAAVPVIEGIRRTDRMSGHAQFSVSGNGSLVYLPGPVSLSSSRSLSVVDRDGRKEPLKLQPGPYTAIRVSPDGKRVALWSDDGKSAFVVIYELDGLKAPRRLTFGGKDCCPVWSPDGQWIAFTSDREGDNAIYQQRMDGTGTAERLTKAEKDASHIPTSWSPDGNTLLFEVHKAGNSTLMALSLRDKSPAPFGDVQFRYEDINAAFSPDGRWVAYTAAGTPFRAVYVQPFPATGARFLLPRGGSNGFPVWSADGRELIYAGDSGVFSAVAITLHPSFAAGNPVDVFRGVMRGTPGVWRHFDLMPDGRMLTISDLNVPSAIASEIKVVLDWFRELEQRVPVK